MIKITETAFLNVYKLLTILQYGDNDLVDMVNELVNSLTPEFEDKVQRMINRAAYTKQLAAAHSSKD